MLSVVVINKNRLNYLALKIQSLFYQANFSDLDILVVDYSSTDEVVDYCRRRNIRCVRVKGAFSISKARNVGIRYSRNDWICISGNDTVIDRHYLAKLCGMIHSYRDRKIFFSGSFAHFVKRGAMPVNEKIFDLIHSTKRLFDVASPDNFRTYFRSILLSSCIPGESRRRRRWTMADIVREAGHHPLAGIWIQPIISLTLHGYLLDNSRLDDECLRRVHGYIFSERFMRHKQIKPFSFQTFTRSMAEELQGYDESLDGWGGEDEDFVTRAEYIGYRHEPTQLVCLHLEHPKDPMANRRQSNRNIGIMTGRNRIVQPLWGLNQTTEEIC